MVSAVLPGESSAPPLGSVARGVRRRTPQMNGHPRQPAGQNPAYRPSGLSIEHNENANRTGARHALSPINYIQCYRQHGVEHCVGEKFY
jgi:hypothetical protein